MKVVFVGTRHTEDPEENCIDVELEYAGEDNWTLKTDLEEFTITDLQPVIKFLLEDWGRH